MTSRLSCKSWITNNMFAFRLFVHGVINHGPVFILHFSFIKLIMDSGLRVKQAISAAVQAMIRKPFWAAKLTLKCVCSYTIYLINAFHCVVLCAGLLHNKSVFPAVNWKKCYWLKLTRKALGHCLCNNWNAFIYEARSDKTLKTHSDTFGIKHSSGGSKRSYRKKSGFLLL